MELAQIDAHIQRFTNAEHLVGVNLHALATDPMYQLVQNETLQGTSHRRTQKLAKDVALVWPMYLALQDTLAEIRRRRGKGGRLSAAERHEIAELLTGPSVRTEGAEARSIADTLDALRQRYEPVAEAVATLADTLAQTLPRLDAYDETLRRAEADVEALGLDTALVSTARTSIDQLRRRSTYDPLSVSPEDLEEARENVREAAAAVADARHGRDNLPSDIAAADAVIAEIRQLRAEAAAAFEEAHVGVVAPVGVVRVIDVAAIDGPNGLQQRFEQATANRSDWQQLRSELDEWRTYADRLRTQLQRAVTRNQLPTRHRSELRGRLVAFRAKIDAKGINDPAVGDLVDQIHNELYTAPCDLARAEMLLSELTRLLSAKEPTSGGVR